MEISTVEVRSVMPAASHEWQRYRRAAQPNYVEPAQAYILAEIVSKAPAVRAMVLIVVVPWGVATLGVVKVKT